MPTDQEIIDNFAMLVTGQADLPENDPRNSWILVANIALQEFIGLTRYAYAKGLLPVGGEFEPTFPRKIKDSPQA